jgi:hypothetical protein
LTITVKSPTAENCNRSVLLWRCEDGFKTHRTLDTLLTALASLGPTLCGFAGEPEAKTFYGKGAGEVGVIAMTDWDPRLWVADGHTFVG